MYTYIVLFQRNVNNVVAALQILSSVLRAMLARSKSGPLQAAFLPYQKIGNHILQGRPIL